MAALPSVRENAPFYRINIFTRPPWGQGDRSRELQTTTAAPASPASPGSNEAGQSADLTPARQVGSCCGLSFFYPLSSIRRHSEQPLSAALGSPEARGDWRCLGAQGRGSGGGRGAVVGWCSQNAPGAQPAFKATSHGSALPSPSVCKGFKKA